MNYNIDYFINKFEAIPEDKWCVDTQIDRKGRCCAHGHLVYTIKNSAAHSVFSELSKQSEGILYLGNYKGNAEHNGLFAEINNGNYTAFQQPTPKQRILAALYDLKASHQAVKQAEDIINSPAQQEALNDLK